MSARFEPVEIVELLHDVDSPKIYDSFHVQHGATTFNAYMASAFEANQRHKSIREHFQRVRTPQEVISRFEKASAASV
jgi:hypothetical protein